MTDKLKAAQHRNRRLVALLGASKLKSVIHWRQAGNDDYGEGESDEHSDSESRSSETEIQWSGLRCQHAWAGESIKEPVRTKDRR